MNKKKNPTLRKTKKRCPKCGIDYSGSLIEHRYSAGHVVLLAHEKMLKINYYWIGATYARWCRKAKIKLYRLPAEAHQVKIPTGKKGFYKKSFYRTAWYAPMWATHICRNDAFSPEEKVKLLSFLNTGEKWKAIETARMLDHGYHGSAKDLLRLYLKELFPKKNFPDEVKFY